MTKTTKGIVANALIAAIYFVLCMISAPIAYGAIQFRIAELLVFLCFFRKDFVIGVTIGCFLANITSPLMFYDMIFGTLATLVSALMVAYLSPRLLVAVIYPVIVNAFVVGAELYFVLSEPFWFSCLTVGLGELVVMVASYLIILAIMRRNFFKDLLKPNIHQSVTW